jgi:orotate phosphoribosyltransferase
MGLLLAAGSRPSCAGAPLPLSIACRGLAAKNVDVAVADVSRWKTPKTPSPSGGSRSGEALYDNPTVPGTLQPGVRYVLVDDVFTGGGHLQASKRRLEEAGATVDLAVCAGKTSQVKPPAAFAFNAEQIPDLVLLAELLGL